MATAENRNYGLKTPLRASEGYRRDPANTVNSGGRCQYFTAERSRPRAEGRRCSLFARWERGRGHLGPAGHSDTQPRAGKWARSPDPVLSSSSAHFVFFSLIGRMLQTAALQPKRRCTTSCVMGSGGSASTGCCGAGTPGTPRGARRCGPTHSDRNQAPLTGRQQQPPSSARGTARDTFRWFQTPKAVVRPACVPLQLRSPGDGDSRTGQSVPVPAGRVSPRGANRSHRDFAVWTLPRWR